jgi:hypothetical protein
MHSQRDLTVPWRHRRYWCGEDRRREANKQTHTVKKLTTTDSSPSPTMSFAISAVEVIGNMVRYLSLSDYIGPVVHSFMNDDADEQTEKNPPERNYTQVAVNEYTESGAENRTHDGYHAQYNLSQVDFNHTWEVLNDEGTQQVLSLIPFAQQAQHITLLGLYEPDELTKVKPGPQPEERFSVGRSLSVRELWRAEGVDVSKVTILHHKEERPGSYVEVKFL